MVERGANVRAAWLLPGVLVVVAVRGGYFFGGEDASSRAGANQENLRMGVRTFGLRCHGSSLNVYPFPEVMRRSPFELLVYYTL